VLEGEFEFPNGGDIVRSAAGSLVYVPRGNLHTYKNVGSEPGRMLVSQTPGGLHERFFEELGEEAQDSTTPPVMDGPLDIERIVAIAARYSIEMPPPQARQRLSNAQRQTGGIPDDYGERFVGTGVYEGLPRGDRPSR
jgi:hypothetical protein